MTSAMVQRGTKAAHEADLTRHEQTEQQIVSELGRTNQAISELGRRLNAIESKLAD